MFMDKLERTLYELVQSGFRSNIELSRVTGVGVKTIRRRMRNLISNRIIKVIAIPNFIKLGYSAWARIGIKVETGYLERVTNELLPNSSIYFISYTIGSFDIIISVHFNNIAKLSSFVYSDLTKIEGIKSTETMLLVYPRKYRQYTWPAPSKDIDSDFENRDIDEIGKQNIYSLDAIDEKILNILMVDGLARPRDLKSKIGLSEVTIRKHLKNMKINEVYKLEAIPIEAPWEFNVQSTTGIIINSQNPHKIIDTIIQRPEVYLASVSLGRFHIVIAQNFRSLNELNTYLTRSLSQIPGISSLESFIHARPIKYFNTIWPID